MRHNARAGTTLAASDAEEASQLLLTNNVASGIEGRPLLRP